jgi:hypothetical protein
MTAPRQHYGEFTMLSASGERRVARLVERILAKKRTRRDIVVALRAGLMNIERQHPEVRSDSARERICTALDDYCDASQIERVNCSEF